MNTQKSQLQSHIPKTRPINGNTPVSAVGNITYGSNTTDQLQTNTTNAHGTSTATSRNTDKYSRLVCHYCHKKGHIGSQCYALKRAEARKRETGPSVVQHVVLKTNEFDNAKQKETDTFKVIPLFNSHWCTATLTRSDQSQRNLTVLRDSDSLQSLISRDKLSSHDYVDTGESLLIKGVTGDVVRVPLVEVDLQSKFGTGKYLFALVQRGPSARRFPGVS